MSDLKHIQALLEKFWEAETTLEEERALKSYFASEQVDASLKQYAPLFQAVREEQAVQLSKPKMVPLRPQQYAWKGWAVAASIALLLAAGAWWLFSTPVESTIVAEQQPIEQPKESLEKSITPTETIVAQTETTKFRQIFRHKKNRAKQEKTPRINAEEQAAMEEIKSALALVSSKIRKGRQEAAKGAEHLETIDKIFKRKEG